MAKICARPKEPAMGKTCRVSWPCFYVPFHFDMPMSDSMGCNEINEISQKMIRKSKIMSNELLN